MDIIFIDDLRIDTLIGIYPREKCLPQSIEINLQIGIPAPAAGASDDIGDTIDYAAVVARLRAELATRHFQLLEKLAEFIANLIRTDFAAPWVRVSVAKIAMLPGVRRAGVLIERGARPGNAGDGAPWG